MFTRRRAIITAAGAIAATALPSSDVIAYPEARGTIVRDLAYDLGWDQDIAWIASNRADAHVYNIETIPTHRAMVALHRAIQPHELQEALFNGLAPYDLDGQHHSQFFGLRDYYDTTDETRARNARNVIDAGDRGNNLSSIYLVGWHERAVAMTAPDGVDLTAPYNAALVIRDWRYAVRIANLDIVKADPIHVQQLMAEAFYRLPATPTGVVLNAAFYLPGKVKAAMPGLSHYYLIPVRGVGALNWTEQQVI